MAGRMTEQKCSSLKQKDVLIVPEQVIFSKQGILFMLENGRYDQLDEDRILLVCIEQDKKNERTPIRLPVEEVTPQTKGRLFLATIYRTLCEIQTSKMNMNEGTLLINIVQHYPWLWVGDHKCLDSNNKKEWIELQDMVEKMRACSILFESF